ncbi:MAG: hypothetical protein V4534_07985 [Myxococcota bacterium]
MFFLSRMTCAVVIVALWTISCAQNPPAEAEQIGVSLVEVPEKNEDYLFLQELERQDLSRDVGLQQAKDLCEQRIRSGLEEGSLSYEKCKNIGERPLRYTVDNYIKTIQELGKLGVGIRDLRIGKRLCINFFNAPPFGENISEYQKLSRKFFEAEKWQLQRFRSVCMRFADLADQEEVVGEKRRTLEDLRKLISNINTNATCPMIPFPRLD